MGLADFNLKFVGSFMVSFLRYFLAGGSLMTLLCCAVSPPVPPLVSTVAKTSVLSLEDMQQMYSLEQLDAVGNYLLTLVDEQGTSSCGLKSEEARDEMRPLHLLRDRKLSAAIENFKLQEMTSSLKTCRERCSCGSLLDLYEGLPSEQKPAQMRRRIEMALKKQDLRQCVSETEKFFCGSSLQAYLKQESRSGEK